MASNSFDNDIAEFEMIGIYSYFNVEEDNVFRITTQRGAPPRRDDDAAQNINRKIY